MRKYVFGCLVAAALLAVVAAPVAQADSVGYTTTGTFGPSFTSSSITMTGGNGTPTLTFIGISSVPVYPGNISGTADVEFGTFDFTGGAGSIGATLAETAFKLTISQYNPVGGTYDALATVSGTLSKNNETLLLVWNSGQNSFAIPSAGSPKVVYTLNDLSWNVNNHSHDPIITGTATPSSDPVPLPAAAWSTLGLLGMLGLGRVLRRKAA